MDAEQLFSPGLRSDGPLPATDWQASPLGHPRAWALSLQRAARLCLEADGPAALCWGRELAAVCNAAWAQAFPAWRADLQGRPLEDSLPDLHAALAPVLRELFVVGAMSRREAVSLVVNGPRPHGAEPVGSPAPGVILDVQPLPGDDGRAAGLLLSAASLPVSTANDANVERILASIGDGFVVLDRDLRYTYVNDAAVRMCGLPREAMLGRTPYDLLTPELIASAMPHVLEAQRRGRALQYELHVTATGRWSEHRVYPSGDNLCISFSDITERKQAEDALRRSEAAYRLIVSLGDAIRGMRDRDAIVAAVVECAGRHFGAGRCFYGELDGQGMVTARREYRSTGETVIGRHQMSTLGDAIAQELREGRSVVVGDVRADPRLAGSEAAARFAQMEVRSLVIVPRLQAGCLNALFIVDDPRPRQWSHADVALIEQVAERLQVALDHARAEADLEQSRDRLARAHDGAAADADRLSVALHAAKLGTWSWSVTDNVVTLSDRAQELFGVDRPHVTRDEIRQQAHPEDRERSRSMADMAMVSRSDFNVEYRVRHGASERWISVSGRGRYDERGGVVAMLGVVQDISHDRLLVRLDDMVRSLSDPEEITATAARVLGRFLHADRCAYAVTDPGETQFHVSGNYTAGVSSLVGSYPLDHLGLEPLRLFWTGLPWVTHDTMTDPRLVMAERVMYREAEIGAIVCAPILKGGRLVAVMAVHSAEPRRWAPGEVELVKQVASRCWESLERARVERERVGLLEAAQAANRAKDEFLAMLGHELRNPLAPIMTALQLMKLRLGDAATRERTVIERQIGHLARLVDDLLDVSRIARGTVELKRERVELADIVARAIEVASPLLEQRAHALEVSVPRDGLTLDADPARLAQVVGNLLTNAAKYTPAGGRVSVAATRDDSTLVLRVRDTGIGIAPDVLPRVFDLFVQGHQGLDRAQGGLGLGLTIARSLVERHGGVVQAQSGGLGLGSEFVVRLPRAAEQAPVGVPADIFAPAIAPGRRRGHVLIVDDNEDAAEMLATALQARGFITHTAHDGLQALDILAVVRPAAALLDIGLPVMDGYELAGRLRQLPDLAEMRLIAVTGYGQESDRLRAREAGFHHHMVKPVDLDCLYGLLDDVVSAEGSPVS